MSYSSFGIFLRAFVFVSMISSAARANDIRVAHAADPLVLKPGALAHVAHGPLLEVTTYADGTKLNLPTHTVTRVMCGSDVSNVAPADVANWAEMIRQASTEGRQVQVLSDRGNQPGPRGVGLDIVINLTGSPPPGAATAMETAAAYIEAQFSDPISFTINASFGNLPSGVIGATSSAYVETPYTTARTGLVNGMDATDTIQAFLPAGSTIPVIYDWPTMTITNENRVYVTVANFRAAIGSASGTAASMTYNQNFNFDFDPSNGITSGTTDFQSVVVHEILHAMGFTSGVDFRSGDIEMLDFYRFQRTSNNPSTTAEFATTPRLAHNNVPDDDHNSDIISAEYRMSDGNPNQASHFREGLNAIMDPTIAAGQTFYPNFMRAPDFNMMDAIGWDYPAVPADVTPPSPDPMTFSVLPTTLSTSSITMSATTATDATNPVQYYFEESTGNPGGSQSGWTGVTSFVDSGLQANTPYTFRVKARDGAVPPNETDWSEPVTAVTLIQTPGAPAFMNSGPTSVTLTATGVFTNLNVEMSGLYFDCLTPDGIGGIQVWTQSTTAMVTGLTPNTSYLFRVKARNQIGVETPYGSVAEVTTAPIFGDCNNDFVVDVEGDLPCYVDALLGIDTDPPGGIERSDVNFDGMTDALDIPEMVFCLVFGCN